MRSANFLRQLVGDPVEVLLEDLTTKFLAPPTCDALLCSPAGPARIDRCLPYRLWGEPLLEIHLNFIGAPDSY